MVLITVLFLVGGAGAAKPVKEPVDKIVLIHYKDGVGAKAAPVLSAASYKLLGFKWQSFPVHYRVNPANGDEASVTASFATWDGKTSVSASSGDALFQYDGTESKAQAANDGMNLVFWKPMGEDRSNIIAMTTIWHTRRTKQITETDIQMNGDMPWGIGVPNAYDIQNIATHEAGHVCGLADLYGPRDGELTMYGYGSLGETKKRSLEPGDVAGLQKLYGT